MSSRGAGEWAWGSAWAPAGGLGGSGSAGASRAPCAEPRPGLWGPPGTPGTEWAGELHRQNPAHAGPRSPNRIDQGIFKYCILSLTLCESREEGLTPSAIAAETLTRDAGSIHPCWDLPLPVLPIAWHFLFKDS